MMYSSPGPGIISSRGICSLSACPNIRCSIASKIFRSGETPCQLMSTQTLSSVRCGPAQFELPACVEREYITWFGVRNSGLQCLRGNDHAKVCFDFGGGVADLGCDGLQ